jgi:hypothetical protein
MAVFIATNTIRSANAQLLLNRAISDAIGVREGAWRVSITESPDQKVWNLTVKGPNGFRWKQVFTGTECTPYHVSTAILATLEKSEAELDTALSELVKEGVMFSREMRPDGEFEYVIDRTRLSGEDVKYLRSRGALTRRGIEQYLVGRRRS